MKCSSNNCQNEAIYKVYWPGQLTYKCMRCAQKAKSIADILGFVLTIEELEIQT